VADTMTFRDPSARRCTTTAARCRASLLFSPRLGFNYDVAASNDQIEAARIFTGRPAYV